MFSYGNTNRVQERRSLVSASKAAGDAIKTDGNTKGVAVHAGEDSDNAVAVLTLDDFGGRSDALGG
jgi:hypothetical protein